jgi:type III secretion protein W
MADMQISSVGIAGQGGLEESSAVSAKDTTQEISAEKISAQKSADAEAAENIQRPKTPKIDKSKDTRKSHIKKLKAALKDKLILPMDQQKGDKAKEFEDKTQGELKSASLILLRNRIKPDATPEDILEIVTGVNGYYTDPSLADTALEFLLTTTEGVLHQTVLKAKDMHIETNAREIAAGQNIAQQARDAAKIGLGTATGMRDMYRDITGNPRDVNTLFNELSQKYPYQDMIKVTTFLLHSLGADLKSKGPSISRGELSAVWAVVKGVQALRGVYSFFKGRMSLIKKLFNKANKVGE